MVVVNLFFVSTVAISVQERQAICAILNSMEPNTYCDCTFVLVNCNYQLFPETLCPCSNCFSCIAGSITTFDIHSIPISGTIPTQIGLLVSLTYLHFRNSIIGGTLPTEIGQLSSLNYLDASYTNLSGGFPQLSNLTNLSSLHLGGTNICGCPLLPIQLKGTCSNKIDIQCSCPNFNCTCCSCVNKTCPQANISLTNQSIHVSHPNPNFENIPPPSYQHVPQNVPNVGNVPLQPNIPLPGYQHLPQNVPNVGNMSIPSINESTQQTSPSILPYVPDVDCQGSFDHEGLFICKSGYWTFNSDVTLNGTNLLNGKFDFPSLFIYGKVIIQESIVIIQNNLLLQYHSVMILENSDITVNGDFLNLQSTIVLNTNYNFTFHIKHCAFLNGSLIIIDTHQSKTMNSLQILTSQCINGTFSSIFVNLTDTSQCNVIIQDLEFVQDILSVSFDFHCNSELQTWVYIIVGIAVLMLLIVFIGLGFVVWRNLVKQQKDIDKIKNKLRNMEK